VASDEFLFALEFSSQGVPAWMVKDLAGQVFRYVHCSEGDVSGLTGALEDAVAKGAAGDARCDVQFRAGHGRLDVLVSSNGGRVWQTSLTIP
jgi:hypothetical protein